MPTAVASPTTELEWIRHHLDRLVATRGDWTEDDEDRYQRLCVLELELIAKAREAHAGHGAGLYAERRLVARRAPATPRSGW